MRPALTVALLYGLCSAALAEPLTELPQRWAERVAAIPQQRLTELEDTTAERIRETRARLNELLSQAEVPEQELAAAYGRLGALYAAHRLYAGAELALANARALDPQGLPWTYYAAHIALEQGEAGQALQHLTAARQIDPSYPPLALRRGEALLGLNRLDAARAAYQAAVESKGLRAAALYGLGQIDLLERDWTGAAARLGEVLELQPAASAAHYPLGQALLRLGRRDEAREHLARRGDLKPTYADPLVEELRALQTGASFHFEEALAAVKRRDYAAAAAAFAAGLAEQPGNARARTSYARALWIAGEHEAAQAALRRAVADGPAETLPRFLLAVVQDAAGDLDAAAGGYREVLKIDPDHQGALSYLANLNLRRGDYAAAAGLFERAIAAGATEMPVLLHYWGALLHAGGDEAMLRDRLLEFDRRFPEPPLFRLLLARLLAGARDAAVANVEQALAIARELQAAQPIPPHTELMALILAASGDFTQAVELQEGLVRIALMTGALAHAAALEQTAEGYREGRLPDPFWPIDDPLFMPPPADPASAMRNYPAGQPY
jgi:tetratricopeptide (TPR) repeat protein